MLLMSVFMSCCVLAFSKGTENSRKEACNGIVTCSHSVRNSKNKTICKYHGYRIGIHNVFSSFAVLINSSTKFMALRSISLKGLEKDIEMKESGYLKRIFKVLTGGLLQTSTEYSEKCVLESSPFTSFFFTFVFEDKHDAVDVHCHQALVDKKLLAFFVFGLVLFFFAETLSRNVFFFYASGVTLGLLMSWMIILIIILKLVPYKKSLFVAIAAGGTSIGLFITQSFIMNLKFYAQYHSYWLIWYMGIISLLIFAMLYYRGPPKNMRTLNLIRWSLQLLGAMFMFNSTWALEVAVTIIVVTLSFYITLQYVDVVSLLKSFIWYCLPYRLRYKLKPPKRQLLTSDEYEEEVRKETETALKELRAYCSSPDCDSWKVVSKLKDPKRFANFVKTGNMFQDEEIKAHEDFEPEENAESWLSSDEDPLPESTLDEELEDIVQISEESLSEN